MFGRSKSKGNYAYSVTRVRAKKSSLLKEDSYAKMLMMSVPEISRFISESGYQKEMTELAGRIEGIDLLEHATYRNMANVFGSILKSATGDLREMLSAYLEKWDIWNLKVILRGKMYGVDTESIREDLVPAGELSLTDLERLLAADSAEDILAAFGKMAEADIPQNVMAAYKASGNLTEIEDHLDKLHYMRLIEKIDPSSRPARLFQDFVRTEIDTVNLGTILKLKAEGIHGADVMEYIIPGGKQINKQLGTQIANADTIASAAADIAQLDFHEEIKAALEEGSLRGIVIGMKRYQMRLAKRFSHLHPLSVIPILDFMIHKEIEVSNIRIIARGMASGIDRETIKGLLVM
jgi:V/A-type H+-transporting ATPase subunit C